MTENAESPLPGLTPDSSSTASGPALRVLLLLNVAVYGLESGLSSAPRLAPIPGDILLLLGAIDPASIWNGEIWRLLTGAFLHGSLLHLGVNLYSLWVLGFLVESLLGPVRFAALYLGTAISASLASLVFNTAMGVGASGAVFGCAGALMVMAWVSRAQSSSRQLFRRLVWVVVLNLVLAELVNRTALIRIDNAAHVGGLVAGVFLGAALLPANVGGRLRYAGAAAWLLAVAAITPRALMPYDTPQYHVAQAARLLDEGDAAAARAQAEAALGDVPHDPGALLTQHEACDALADTDCALDSLEHLLTLEPLPPDGAPPSVDGRALQQLLLVRGAVALKQRQYTLALPLLRRAMELAPDEEDPLNAWAWTMLCQGNLAPDQQKAVLDAADRARRISGGSRPEITHTYAEALRQAGQLDRALEVLAGLRRGNTASPWLQWFSSGELGDAFYASEEERMRAGVLPSP